MSEVILWIDKQSYKDLEKKLGNQVTYAEYKMNESESIACLGFKTNDVMLYVAANWK
jgi:hypothetical protein